jgi:endonuclease/exonuclease/phosphatase family metal-dependent hydrolase
MSRAFSLLVFTAFLGGCSRLEPILEKGEDCRRTEVIDEEVLLPEHVEWVKAPEGGGRNTLALWCETVGPAVFDPTPVLPDTTPADSIAIVSWNTHVGGGEIDRFLRDLRTGRLTDGAPVRHFVLLLQEVHRGGPAVPGNLRIGVPGRIAVNPPDGKRVDIVETARRLGLSLLYVPSMRNGAQTTEPEDRGNAILSTFELKRPRAFDLPFERQRRVVAQATVEGETSTGRNWKLPVASVHLDNRSTWQRLPASVGPARFRQSAALTDHFEEEEPIAIGGDFNTWAPALFEKAIPMLRKAFEDSPPPVNEITYVKGRMRRRIDYMFFRLPDGWEAKYKRAPRSYGSDHYPLVGWVKFGGAASTQP